MNEEVKEAPSEEQPVYMLDLRNTGDEQCAAILLSAAMRVWGVGLDAAVVGLQMGKYCALGSKAHARDTALKEGAAHD